MPRMLCRRCRLPNSTPRRKLTTTTLSSEQQQQRVVISRRVYQAFQKQQQQAKGNHHPPSTKTKPKSADDKPWPQNVRIAGYVAGSFFVPYSLVWFVTSNPSLRDSSSVLQNFVNQEWIRQHFGEAEWDAKSYADSHEDLVAEDYTYPSELWNRNERLLEKTITTMEQEEVPTTINVYTTAKNGNGNETMSTTSTSTTKMLPGSTRANRQTLMELQQSNSSGGATENDDSYVTVDFPQDDEDKTTITTSHNDDLDSSLSLSVDDKSVVDDPTLPLLQQTHTFSNWQYHQTASSSSSSDGSGGGGGRGVVRMTDQQAELANLEFTIQELETLLQDPNCPRDMDDVRDELKESKRKLFRKRWKQRLGF